jgi:predicted esterase
MKWFGAAQMGGEALAALIREMPPGLEDCRTRLKQLISEVRSQIGDIPLEKIVFAGFSQGAMTAMDLALDHDVTVGGVAMLSGAPIVVEEWAKKVGTRHKGIKVYISHGR